MKNTTKSKEISGKEIDRKFDNGEDVLEYFDLEHPIIENHSNEQKHVTFIMPEWILRIMKFFRVATTRQSNKTRDKTKTCRRIELYAGTFCLVNQLLVVFYARLRVTLSSVALESASTTSKLVAKVSSAIKSRNCSTLATSEAGTLKVKAIRSLISKPFSLRAS